MSAKQIFRKRGGQQTAVVSNASLPNELDDAEAEAAKLKAEEDPSDPLDCGLAIPPEESNDKYGAL